MYSTASPGLMLHRTLLYRVFFIIGLLACGLSITAQPASMNAAPRANPLLLELAAT
ncbi:MAG: hypothetical protein SH847_18485 [Roseiflexaceae bacterium]|nr:hypothetical protein [Roseiflexaceae bacterium]